MIKVNIVRKDIRHLYLKVKADGSVILSAPFNTRDEDIKAFLKEKQAWIIKHVENSKLKASQSKLVFNDHLYYLGRKYPLIIKNGQDSLSIRDDITIYTKDDVSKTFYKLAKNNLLEVVEDILPKYVNILKDYHYDKLPIIKIKAMKGKWGVCYPNKNEISLNAKLIHFDIRCIEAVLWHEILHLVIPNHSKRFHQVLEYHLPDYKDLVKSLY